MRKLICVLLFIVFALSLASCDKPCTEHVDKDGDGVCDTPGCYEGLKSDKDPAGTELPWLPVEPDWE